jgi:thiamine-phosphate pyrophosphorylase
MLFPHIGGIGAANAGAVRQTGADGLSVISAILGNEDIAGAAKALFSIWNG